jgi:hypothetical protein
MQRAVSTPKKAIERQLSVFSVFFFSGKEGRVASCMSLSLWFGNLVEAEL